MKKRIFIIINILLIIAFASCNKVKVKDKFSVTNDFKYFYIDIKGFDSETQECLKNAFIGKKVSCNDIFHGEYLNMAMPSCEALDSIKFLDAKTLPESNFVDNLYKIIVRCDKSESHYAIDVFISEAAGQWRRIRCSDSPIDYSNDSFKICEQIEYGIISHMTL